MYKCEVCGKQGANFCIMMYLDNHKPEDWQKVKYKGEETFIPHAMKLVDICSQCLMRYSSALVIDQLQPIINHVFSGKEHNV